MFISTLSQFFVVVKSEEEQFVGWSEASTTNTSTFNTRCVYARWQQKKSMDKRTHDWNAKITS